MTEENAQAKIGDTLYASAATAAEALKDDETLTLLKDITGEGAGDDAFWKSRPEMLSSTSMDTV